MTSRRSGSVSLLSSRFESPSVVAERRAEELREVRRVLDREDERRRREQQEQQRVQREQREIEQRLIKEEEERAKAASEAAEQRRLAEEKQQLLTRLKLAEQAFERVKKASLALEDSNTTSSNNSKNIKNSNNNTFNENNENNKNNSAKEIDKDNSSSRKRSGPPAVVSRLPAKFFGQNSNKSLNSTSSKPKLARGSMSKELFSESLDRFEPESKRLEAKNQLKAITENQRNKQKPNWSQRTVPDVVIDTMNSDPKQSKEDMQNYLIAKVLYDDINENNGNNLNNNASKNGNKREHRKEDEMDREMRQYLESVGAEATAAPSGGQISNQRKTNFDKSNQISKKEEKNEHELLSELSDIKQRLKFGALANVRDKEKVRKFDAMVGELQNVQSNTSNENEEKSQNSTQNKAKFGSNPRKPKAKGLEPKKPAPNAQALPLLEQVQLKPTQKRQKSDFEPAFSYDKKSPFGEEIQLKKVVKPNLRRLRDIVNEAKVERGITAPLRPVRTQKAANKTNLRENKGLMVNLRKSSEPRGIESAPKSASNVAPENLAGVQKMAGKMAPPKVAPVKSATQLLDEFGELIGSNANLMSFNLTRSFDRLEYKVFRKQPFQLELDQFLQQARKFVENNDNDSRNRAALKRDVEIRVKDIKDKLDSEEFEAEIDDDDEVDWNDEDFENFDEIADDQEMEEAMEDMQNYMRSLDQDEPTTSINDTTKNDNNDSTWSTKKKPELKDHENLDAFLDDMDDYLKTLEGNEKSSAEQELEQYLNQIIVEDAPRPKPKIQKSNNNAKSNSKSILEDEGFLRREAERKKRMEQIKAMQNNRSNTNIPANKTEKINRNERNYDNNASNNAPLVPERRSSLTHNNVNTGNNSDFRQPEPPMRRDSLTKTGINDTNVVFTATPDFLTNPPMGNDLVALAVGLETKNMANYEPGKADASYLQPKQSIEEEIASYKARDQRFADEHIRSLALRQKAKMQNVLNNSTSNVLNLNDEEGGKVWKWKQKKIEDNQRVINENNNRAPYAKPVQRNEKAMRAFSTMFAKRDGDNNSLSINRSVNMDDSDEDEKEEEEKEDLSYLRGSCANVRAKFEAQIKESQPSLLVPRRNNVQRSASCTSFAEHLRRRNNSDFGNNKMLKEESIEEEDEVKVKKGLVNAMRNQVINQYNNNSNNNYNNKRTVNASKMFTVPEEERSLLGQEEIRRQLEMRAALSSVPRRSQNSDLTGDFRHAGRHMDLARTKFENYSESKSNNEDRIRKMDNRRNERRLVREEVVDQDELPDISDLLASHKYSDSRENIAAELAEVRKAAKTKNLMSINNRKENHNNNNRRTNRPSLLDKSYSTTSVDMDESVLENVSRNKAMIKNKIKQMEEDNKNNSNLSNVSQCRPRIMPSNRRWVLDTVNKYFDPIAEDEDDVLLERPMPKKLNSERMQAFESDSPQLKRSSNLEKSASSSQMRDRLKAIMNKNSNLDLSHFKRNLSDHLKSGLSRENSVLIDSDEDLHDDDNDLYTRVEL